jgi:WD40 repeat protein
VNAVGFSPDGRLLATGGTDRAVILWDVTDPAHPALRASLAHPRPGRPLRRFWLDPGVRTAGFSPDGKLLACGTADWAVILWDMTDPAHPALRASLAHPRPGLGATAGADNGVRAAGFSPDGRMLACTSGKTVVVWDIADPAHPRQRAALTHRPRRFPTDAANAAGFSPDGKLLATAATAGKDTAILWDATDLDHPARLAAITAGRREWAARTTTSAPPTVKALGFSPDSRLLATGSGQTASSEYGSSSSGAVVLWDVTDPAHPCRTAPTLPRSRGAGEVHAVTISPNGRLLATDEGTAVTVWDITDPAYPAKTSTLAHRRLVRGIAFSPDSRLLASCGTDIRLWDMR